MGMQGGIKMTDKLPIAGFSVTFVRRGAAATGCYPLVDQGRAIDASNRTEIKLKMVAVRKHWEWGRKT